MKRIGFLYEKICSTENIRLAVKNACKHKRKKRAARWVLRNCDYCVAEVQRILVTESFTPSQNIFKTIYDQSCQKERQLEIPKFFPDRIIHWAVCQVLKPVFMKGMYRWNVGSIPGRGISDGRKYIKRVRVDYKSKYIAKLDMKKYFPSISQPKLKQLLRRRIKDKQTLNLLDKIIDSGSKGLPIGYYTSQWLANFYFQEVDHYIKEKLHVRYYVRNVDDMVWFGTNKRKLHSAIVELQVYLVKEGYCVRIKENWQVWKNGTRPLDFLGYKDYPNRVHLRNGAYFRFMRKVFKTLKRGYCTVKMARGIMSGFGRFKMLPHGKRLYENEIKPIISKGECRRIISIYDKRIQGERKNAIV